MAQETTVTEDTKVCPKCATNIPKQAIRCPNCRSKIGTSRLGKLLAIFFGLFIVMMVISVQSATPTPRVPGPETEPGWADSAAGKLCSKHPDWQPEECVKVAGKKIWIGMDYDMLVYQYGKPDSINPSNYGGGTRYQYCWHDYSPSCFYDENGDNKIDAYN
ncbi:MAG: hypothetical protein QOE22_703 [Candidatus Parcubacteria bacterium]|nr:hypothetical protein [Candidatus Parcubacteria bacterium]